MGTQSQQRQQTHSPNSKGIITALNRLGDQSARSNKLLAAILEQLQRETAVLEPNYRRDLADYGSFDWSSIAATVIEKDDYGAIKVEWSGHHWLRRNSSPDNKFGAAVWFSRPVSGSGDATVYYTLIKFAPYKAERMAHGTAPKLNGRSAAKTEATAVSLAEKEWKAEAEAATDELIFDSAYQEYRSDYFTDSTKVQSARVHICGEWVDDPQHAARCVAALDVYANYITAEEEKQRTRPGKIDGQVGIAKAKRAFKDWKYGVQEIV